MAGTAAKYFGILQKLVKNDPAQRETYISEARRLNFEQYKNNVATFGQAAAPAYDIHRQWNELGINEYLLTPNLLPEVVESNIYGRCISSNSQ